MRVKTVKSTKGSISYSIIRDITKPDGKRSTEIVQNLGNHETLQQLCPEMAPMDYARKIARELSEAEAKGKVTVVKEFDSERLIERDNQNGYDIGYLFIDKLFYELKLDRVCTQIAQQSRITFDLGQVLKTLVSTRILYPSSKRHSLQLSKSYLTPPSLELQHIYRGLDVLAEHSERIQEAVYKNSAALIERDTRVLYYDCTNFFFEIEEEDDLRKYGKSKENRPNPIVQMGLFMDGSGLPLAYTMFAGSNNEQPSLKPLEKRVIRDFNLSELVVCTDAGLSSNANRRFNNTHSRRYVTTQSLKKFRKPLKEWALDKTGWQLAHTQPGDPDHRKLFNLDEIDLDDRTKTYYKERWEPAERTTEEKKQDIRPLEERYIVTFSPKYKAYQATIRERQIDRALKKLDQKEPLKTNNPHSPDRFIKRSSATAEGELAKDYYALDQSVIDKEAQYDGFYCVATNLETEVEDIIAVNQRRWEIEESFKIMKTEFKSRPIYLSKENRIKAHFLTCFLSLLIFRMLEKRMNSQHTICEIIQALRGMKLTKLTEDTFLPHYTRTHVTDSIHQASGFRTDYQLLTKKKLKTIEKNIRERK